MDFRIIGVMAKTLYGYWSGHPCLVGVVGPNVARVLIIEADNELPSSHFNFVAGVMLNDIIYSESQVFG